jgi:DNA-binding GntR family transcriptional regulator
VINRRSATPPYRQVAADLRARISRGDLAPGSRLPAYATLAHDYQVGVGTITRAVQLLRDAGLVETGTGADSYIKEPPRRKTAVLPSGSTVVARMPTDAEQEAQGIDPGVPVIEVTSASGEITVYPADRWAFTSR